MNYFGLCAVCAVGVTACVRTAPTPAVTYWVSSDASQYSPVARFRVVSARDGSQLRVIVDSGALVVPGELTAQSPVVMTNLYLTAFVAATNVGPMGIAAADSLRFPDRRGWRAVATSDSLLLAGELRYGEQRPIGHLQLTMPRGSPGEGPQWLVFRISGKVVDLRIPFDERGGLRAGKLGSATRVYACSDRDLGGQLDTARSNGLRRAYGLLC